MTTKKKIIRIQPRRAEEQPDAKGNVLLDLLQHKKNLLGLYKSLHPEDTDVTEDDLEILATRSILTGIFWNAIAFTAHGSQLLVLVVEQPLWSENILLWTMKFMAQAYRIYLKKTGQDPNEDEPIKVPGPEAYIVYVGGRDGKPDVLTLADAFFDGKDAAIKFGAEVICEGEREGILEEYIQLCKIFSEQIEQYGMTSGIVKETIQICKERGCLREYLTTREFEATMIMEDLLDQAIAASQYGKEMELEADRDTAERLIRKGKMSLQDIADCIPSLSLDELREIEADTAQMT